MLSNIELHNTQNRHCERPQGVKQSRPIKHGIATPRKNAGLAMTVIWVAFLSLIFVYPVFAADDCVTVLGGVCKSTKDCDGVSVPGHCSGEADNQCCVPAGLGGASGFFKEAGSKAGFGSAGAQAEPEVVIGKIIEGALVIIGTIFGVLMVYAGYLWMQARGNEEYVKKAKGILEAAIIGIILVMAAYAITAFIVSRVIGAAQFGL